MSTEAIMTINPPEEIITLYVKMMSQGLGSLTTTETDKLIEGILEAGIVKTSELHSQIARLNSDKSSIESMFRNYRTTIRGYLEEGILHK